MNTLAETPVARCGSQADCPAGTNRLPTRQRTGTKAPPNAARAPCAPPIQQPTATRKLPHADLPAGPPRRPLPAPKGGGARVPGRAAPPLHAPALRARGGRWSAARGDGARSGLSLPAAHRAPSPSSPGPSRGAHTHLTSARIKARGAAPDGGPQRSRARLRCSRCSRTARPRAAHASSCRGCCKLDWGGGGGGKTGGGDRTCSLTAALLWRPASHQQILQPVPHVPIDHEDQAAGDPGAVLSLPWSALTLNSLPQKDSRRLFSKHPY